MPATITRRPASAADEDFAVEAHPVENVIAGDETTQTEEQDLVKQNYTGATVDNEAVVEVTPLSDLHEITLENLTPEVSSLDEISGRLTRIADGEAKVRIAGRHKKRIVTANMLRQSGQTTSEVIGFAEGSLIKAASEAIDGRIEGLTANSTTRNIFTTQNHTTATYVRNPDCWAFGLPLSGISPWNSHGGQRLAGTLITPRHAVFAWHFKPNVGTTLRYISDENEVVERTLIARQRVGLTDIMVGLLDSDVPETIAHYPILPADIDDYLPNIHNPYHPPTLGLDQQERATVQELHSFDTGAGGSASVHGSNDPQRQAFWLTKVSGDSGNPCFLLADGELILILCWYSATTGPNLGNNLTALNAVLTNLGGGYEATVWEPSHTNYGE